MRRRWHELFLKLGLDMQEYAGVDIDFEDDNQESGPAIWTPMQIKENARNA